MKRILFVAIAMLGWTHLVQAQTYDSALFVYADTVYVYEMRDTNHVHMGHYAQVTQYFEYSGVGVSFGEVNVRGGSGDTLERPMDHPLTFMDVTDELLVYDIDATSFMNEIKSKVFSLSSGDTVFYVLSPEIHFPKVWPSDTSLEMTLQEDTTHFAITDSVLFRVELIDAINENVLEVLDSIMFVPIDHFWQVENSIIGFPFDSTVVDWYERSWIPTSDYTGDDLYRLRLTPVYIPQQRSDYSDRVLYTKYFWAPRFSAHFRRVQADSLFWKRGVGNVPHIPAESRLQLKVSPNILSKNMANPIQITGNWDLESEIIISITDVRGQVLWTHNLPTIGLRGNTISIQPRIGTVSSGTYFLRVRQANRSDVAKLIIH